MNTRQAWPGRGWSVATASSTLARVATWTCGSDRISGEALKRWMSCSGTPARARRSAIAPVALSNTGSDPSPATRTAVQRCGPATRAGAATCILAQPVNSSSRTSAVRIMTPRADAGWCGAYPYPPTPSWSARRIGRMPPGRRANRPGQGRQSTPPPRRPCGAATARCG